jgi:ribosome modulation factor
MMEKKTGRKANLRRLAAKRGWDDGVAGRDARAPTKAVMTPFANGFGCNSLPWDEELSYMNGYEEGLIAKTDAVNPYSSDNK